MSPRCSPIRQSLIRAVETMRQHKIGRMGFEEAERSLVTRSRSHQGLAKGAIRIPG